MQITQLKDSKNKPRKVVLIPGDGEKEPDCGVHVLRSHSDVYQAAFRKWQQVRVRKNAGKRQVNLKSAEAAKELVDAQHEMDEFLVRACITSIFGFTVAKVDAEGKPATNAQGEPELEAAPLNNEVLSGMFSERPEWIGTLIAEVRADDEGPTTT